MDPSSPCGSGLGSSAAFHASEIQRLRGAAGLALVPKQTQPLDVLLAELTFHLPVADRLADDLAGRGIFAGVDGSFESCQLFCS